MKTTDEIIALAEWAYMRSHPVPQLRNLPKTQSGINGFAPARKNGRGNRQDTTMKLSADSLQRVLDTLGTASAMLLMLQCGRKRNDHNIKHMDGFTRSVGNWMAHFRCKGFLV